LKSTAEIAVERGCAGESWRSTAGLRFWLLDRLNTLWSPARAGAALQADFFVEALPGMFEADKLAKVNPGPWHSRRSM
jgi:hypothetical protein